MKRAKIIVAIVLAVLALILFFQNTGPAKVQLLFWPVQMPLVLLLLLTFTIGLAVGYVTPGLVSRKRRPQKR